MNTIILFGILVGLDNLQVSAGIGMNSGRRPGTWILIAAFAFFEAVMPLIGLMMGEALAMRFGEHTEYLGPSLLAACGLFVAYQALRNQDTGKLFTSRASRLALPLLLSLDNLAAGAAFGVMGYPVLMTAVIIGGLSACLCLAGVFLGAQVRERFPKRAALASGIWMLGVAFVALISD